ARNSCTRAPGSDLPVKVVGGESKLGGTSGSTLVRAVSRVTSTGSEAGPWLPAGSVKRDTTSSVKGCSSSTGMLRSVAHQVPSAATTADGPSGCAELGLNRVTVSPGSPWPVKVGVLSLVIRSLSETPVSLPGARDGADAAGGCVSMVTCSGAE